MTTETDREQQDAADAADAAFAAVSGSSNPPSAAPSVNGDAHDEERDEKRADDVQEENEEDAAEDPEGNPEQSPVPTEQDPTEDEGAETEDAEETEEAAEAATSNAAYSIDTSSLSVPADTSNLTGLAAVLAAMPLPTEPGITVQNQKTCAVDSCFKRSQGRKYYFMCARHCREWCELHPGVGPPPATPGSTGRGRKRRRAQSPRPTIGAGGRGNGSPYTRGGQYPVPPDEPDLITRSALLKEMAKPLAPRFMPGGNHKGMCAVNFQTDTLSFACPKQSQGQRTNFMCARHNREWLDMHPEEREKWYEAQHAQQLLQQQAAEAQQLEMQKQYEARRQNRDSLDGTRSRRAAARSRTPVPGGGGYGSGGGSRYPTSGSRKPMRDRRSEAARRIEANGGKVRKFVRVKREIRAGTGIYLWKWLPVADIVDPKERRQLGLGPLAATIEQEHQHPPPQQVAPVAASVPVAP